MDMSKEEFEQKKAESARRIRELYRGHNMPPYPEFVTVSPKPNTSPRERDDMPQRPTVQNYHPPTAATENKNSGVAGLLRCFNMGEILKSPDALLILGLIFLLVNDHCDEKLIMALVFIML